MLPEEVVMTGAEGTPTVNVFETLAELSPGELTDLAVITLAPKATGIVADQFVPDGTALSTKDPLLYISIL
jgi:hypothetical protein